MIELSTIRDLVAIFGVIAGFSYYVLTVRATRRNQELMLESQELSRKAQEQQLETRQFQLLMQLSDVSSTLEGNKIFTEFLNMDWKDYDDFEEKYGSDNNPDNFALRNFVLNWFKTTGLLVKYEMIDPELVYDFNGMFTIWAWNKFKDIELKQREIYNNPQSGLSFEYLYNEMKRIHEKRGHDAETPFNPLEYTTEIRERVHGRT